MDWDIDMGDADSGALDGVPVDPAPSDITRIPLDETYENNDEVHKRVPNKIHIRGLDTLTTADIKSYVSEHYGVVDRVEWIDDNSANLVFASEAVAQEALVAMSTLEIADATQLPAAECIPGKPASSKPEVNLQIRFALAEDKKSAGAASRSRFYLLHPEYDPEERRRREGNRRYRDRDGEGYRPRRSGRRRDEDEVETFDASLYDDDEATLAERHSREWRERRHSLSPGSDRDFARRNQAKELFPDRRPSDGRDREGRGRSASPWRDSDGDQGMNETSRVASSSGNRDTARSIKNRLRGDGAGKSRELFPGRAAGRAYMDDVADEASTLLDRSLGFPLSKGDEAASPSRPSKDAPPVEDGSFNIRGVAKQRGSGGGFAIKGAASANVRELFPDKFDDNAGKELFAEKLEGRGRRRQRAEDLFH